MSELLDFIGNYWWLGFFVVPAVGGWMASVAKYNEKRRRDRIELERVRRAPLVQPQESSTAGEPQQPPSVSPRKAARKELQRVITDHDDIERRWLDYELDVAKLIDFPLITDMREPLTQSFHRARREAAGLRPESEDAELQAADIDRYRTAVRDYDIAFSAAVQEAKRRAQADFSEPERARLRSAQRLMALADNEASTPAERQSAYKQAKRELEGLIALPDATTTDIERRIAGEIQA